MIYCRNSSQFHLKSSPFLYDLSLVTLFDFYGVHFLAQVSREKEEGILSVKSGQIGVVYAERNKTSCMLHYSYVIWERDETVV